MIKKSGYNITFCGLFKFISLTINNLFGMMDKWNNGKHEVSFPIFQYSNFPLLISNLCRNCFAHNILYLSQKKLLTVLFFLIIGLPLIAGSDSLQKVSLYSFDLIRMQNPWLVSSNPAALSQMGDLLPGILNVSCLTEDGNYKRVQQGDKLNHYSFNTFSYSKIKNINLYGGFSFDKSFEKGIDYSDINDPFRLTPFQLIDTIGSDTYDREFFTVAGGMSKPFGKNLILGVACDFNMGLSAQNKDPRPQNKVFKMTVSPGLIYSIGNFKLGFNLLYKYYNEEIEIIIIENNAHVSFFSVHGLGLATSHEASSFNRLYKRNSGGIDVQLAYAFSKVKTLNGVRFLSHQETAGDGRKASNASWSYIKKDSKLKGNQFDLYNNTSIYGEKNIQCFGYELNINSMLGVEIIQRLEQVDSTDLDNWVTYGEEEKYDATDHKSTGRA